MLHCLIKYKTLFPIIFYSHTTAYFILYKVAYSERPPILLGAEWKKHLFLRFVKFFDFCPRMNKKVKKTCKNLRKIWTYFAQFFVLNFSTFALTLIFYIFFWLFTHIRAKVQKINNLGVHFVFVFKILWIFCKFCLTFYILFCIFYSL